MEPSGTPGYTLSMNLSPPGLFPMQCHLCGCELINMGCVICSPIIPPMVKNRGGFPRYAQISLPKHTFRPRTPRNALEPVRQVQYGGVKDGLLMLTIDGKGAACGKQMPFLNRVGKDQTFTVLTKFKWLDHEWHTHDVPCNRKTSEVSLLTALLIHFVRFIKQMEKCDQSHACLCGGPDSTITMEHSAVTGYDLHVSNDTFTISVWLTCIVGPEI